MNRADKGSSSDLETRSSEVPDATPSVSADPPRLTVVVPTYDRADSVVRAVGSILNQDFAALELLVVDDGSNDDTIQRLSSIADDRLRLLARPHRGVSASRNTGVRHARGEIVTFLDSDDEALPGWLDALAEAFDDPEIGIACCGARVLSLRGHQVTGQDVRLPHNDGPFYHDQPILHLAGTLAVRKDLLSESGGFAEELAFAENAELAMRLVPACLEAGLRVVAIKEPLVLYRRQRDEGAFKPESLRSKRASVERILALHGTQMRQSFPRGYANYCAVAAVDAARLGDLVASRHHLARAIGAHPRNWRNYLRWCLTLVPLIARRWWLREAEAVDP